MLTPWWRCIKQDVSTISIVITFSWTQMVLVEKGGSAMWEPGPWFFPSRPVHQEAQSPSPGDVVMCYQGKSCSDV